MAEQPQEMNVVDEATDHIDGVIAEVLTDDMALEDQRQVLINLRTNVLTLLDEVTDALLAGDDLDETDDEKETR